MLIDNVLILCNKIISATYISVYTNARNLFQPKKSPESFCFAIYSWLSLLLSLCFGSCPDFFLTPSPPQIMYQTNNHFQPLPAGFVCRCSSRWINDGRLGNNNFWDKSGVEEILRGNFLIFALKSFCGSERKSFLAVAHKFRLLIETWYF